MRLTIPCEGNEKIQQLLSTLQNFKFNHLKLEIDFNYLNQDSKAKLLKELGDLQIEFQEAQEDEDDADEDDNPMNESNLTFNGSTSQIDDRDIITKTMSDKFIYRFFSLRKNKGNLCKAGEQHNIDIKTDFANSQFIFKGPKNAVNELMKTISTIHYEKSNAMLYSHAECLKSTNQIYKLKREEGIMDMVVIPEESGDNYQIVAYGNNKNQVERFIKGLNKVSGNIITLLDISSKYQYSNESEQILKYLKFICHKKCQNRFEEKKIPLPEILMKEDKRFERYLFFMFVNCSASIFKQIQSWFDKDMASLCILNIKMETDKELPIQITGTSEEKINTFKLKDNSLLLLGKEKVFMRSLKEILTKESTEKVVTQYRLRFKKLFRSELLSTQANRKAFPIEEYTEHCNPLVVKTCFDRSVYVFCLLPRWQDLEKILKVHQDLLKNSSWTSSHKSSPPLADNDNSKSEKTKVFAEDLIDKKIDHQKLISIENISINQPPSTNNLPQRNQNLAFFNLENIPENDWAILEGTDMKSERIETLLRISFPAVEIQLAAFHDPVKWKKYIKMREQNFSEEIQEFTVFYESKESPAKWIGEDEELSLVQVEKNLLTSFNPKRDLHSLDKNSNYEVLVLLVLVKNKGQGQIVGHYPLALAYFK